MILPKEYIESLKNVTNLSIEKLEKDFEKDAKKGVRFNTEKLPYKELNSTNIKTFLSECDENISGNFFQIPWCKEGFLFDEKDKLGKSILHEMGVFYIQEPSAMSPVEFLNVEPNDVVLDLCAAPGGKSTQIASKLNGGFLIANEIVPSRAKILTENVQRLGFDNVVVLNHSPKELENRFENFFDKILVDAPCSGEGMFRKNNDAIYEWTKDLPLQCAIRQKEIVKSAYKMLKPNGTMVYSTCTFSLEENEEVIKFLLDEFDDLEILSIDHKKYNFENGIDIDGTKKLLHCARLYPYNIDGEGHFFAVLHKKQNKDFEENNQYFLNESLKNNKVAKTKNNKNNQKIKIFEQFFANYSKKVFNDFCLIGDFLYANCPIEIDKLKVLNVGLLLGEFKKDNFVPNIHLAHFLNANDFSNTYELSLAEAKKYVEGLEIGISNNNQKTKDGWCLLLFKNIPLCFGKVVNGKIKNHYPKILRKKL